MRYLLILSALLLVPAASVRAQVTLDLHALQALPEHPAPGGSQRPTASITPRAYAPAAKAPSATPAPPPPAPALPEAVPDAASIAPVAPPPPTAPPPPPVSDTAKTAAAPTPEGIRLTFAPGQSDLSPESAASLKQLAAASTDDSTTFNVQAYAQGAPDDPSSARRMSLARAMAVRGALVADGVASAHIFVRALGAQVGAGPPDRVDVDVIAGSPQAAAPR